MTDYLHWDEQRIADFSDANINAMYDSGYVFVRPENGLMQQTRSVRIKLNNFELNSENRRILRKTDGLTLHAHPLPYTDYDWHIGKMGKEFYEQKFGDGTFSANKIKELLTSDKRDDFNRLLLYTLDSEVRGPRSEDIVDKVGYCIAAETGDILHYSYPFYNLQSQINNLGMGMMIRAVQYAKESSKEFIYLGSYQRPGDKYKLQFKGLEWFDGGEWRDDLGTLKQSITL